MYCKTQTFFKTSKKHKKKNVPALTFPVWWQRWDPAC